MQEEWIHLLSHRRSWVSLRDCGAKFLTDNEFHRNAEEMLNDEGKPKTSHTTNKVPFIMANAPVEWTLNKEDGVLGDVAPTIIDAMGLSQPEEMTGRSLLIRG